MAKERRKKSRVHFKAHVILRAGESVVDAEASSKNISMSGVFVNTQKRIPVGTECDLELLLEGTSTRLAINLKGVVARQDEAGLGIAFKSVDADGFVHLKNIVWYNASDPEKIEEEVFSMR